MKTYPSILFVFISIILLSFNSKEQEKHLFILSGQSNMVNLQHAKSFSPVVEAEFGKENVIVVKYAKKGQPIRRWYKDWKPPGGIDKIAKPDLYDSLMNKVYTAIENKKIATITFIWMQGERDAREKLGEVYEESLIGLYNQISNDLERNDVNFIIGRLSDFDLQNEKYHHWTQIRKIQEKVAESNPRFDWINTDDLNDRVNKHRKKIINGLHMTEEGYVLMGKRFAEKSIQIIKK